MEFSATGDEFCRRGDTALEGIGNCAKVIDDIIVWDEQYDDHMKRMREILLRCRKHKITVNRANFVFASPAVQYCGCGVSEDGISADEDKVKAVKVFPTPANITDLRSFMGMVSQSSFSPAIAPTADALGSLLRPRNEFVWCPKHQQSFECCVSASARPFRPCSPYHSPNGRFSNQGLGYALLQDKEGK